MNARVSIALQDCMESPEEEAGKEAEETEETEVKEDRRKRLIRSVLYLLRDLAVAALIVGIILLSLFLYTSNWPPMVVVESQSMQHDDHVSFVGVIDTGDLVLVQKANSHSDIITYVEGKNRDHSTYGAYGDVVVYKRGGSMQDKSIIHRALVRLYRNESGESLDIPDLDSERWPIDDTWSGTNTGTGAVTSPYGLNYTVILHGIGPHNRDISIPIYDFLVEMRTGNVNDSAFVTLGDNNNAVDPDVVRLEWIGGKARGEIPWFGLLKLTLFKDPGAPCCNGWGDSAAPMNSWDALLVSIILIVAVPIVLDFGSSFVIKYWRKRKEAEKETPGSEEIVPESEPEMEREVEEVHEDLETQEAEDGLPLVDDESEFQEPRSE